MAIDKAIDSTLLNTNLTLIANAVRAKSGASAQLAFPDGFVAAINGISGGSYAYIVASFPAGTSSCTCSNGTVTLTADASALAKGLFVFAIPSAGTWTVAASSGTLSKSQSVNITAEGQSESVSISFWDGVLYNAGDQYTDITGGWEKVGTAGTVAFNDTDINLTATSQYSQAAVSTVNAVDLSSFTTLNAVISGRFATSHDTRWYKGVLKAVTLGSTGTETVAATTDLSAGTTGSTIPQTTLDVSGLSGEYYIRIATKHISDSISANIFIHKVWLE